MKICIPTTEKNGLESTVSHHFGRAPFHIIVDLETMQHYPLEKDECEDHGHCLPVKVLLQHNVGAALCKGIGRGAVGNFIQNQVQVYVTTADTVVNAVNEFKNGPLNFVGEEQICKGGHDHDHDHHH
jgi:predicted Fe-Mo cluster-binding NifX family protein